MMSTKHPYKEASKYTAANYG